MARTGLSATYTRRLVSQRDIKQQNERYKGAEILRDHQNLMRADLVAIGKTGNIDVILEAERSTLKDDLVHYANSSSMVSSLENALIEHDAAIVMLVRVRDPERYGETDVVHSNSKNRIGGLPKDQARQFFKSQNARLLNLDKAGLSDTEKAIIDERRRNLRVAEKAYTALQRKALGLGPERGKEQDQGMGL